MVMDGSVTEAAFQDTVIKFAEFFRWYVYHTHDSRRSQPGFPDLVLVRNGQIIFAELKSARGRVSADQQGWINELERCAWEVGNANLLRVAVWRPANWPEIERVLR